MEPIYNITGHICGYRNILYRNLSYDNAISLKNELNSKNEFVKANISLVEGVRKPMNTPISKIIKEWEANNNIGD